MVKHTDKNFLEWMERKQNQLQDDFMEEKSEEFVEFCSVRYDETQED